MRRIAITIVFTALLSLPGATAAAQNDRLAQGAHDVDIGDVRLHYVVRGRGPILFVTSPGWGIGSGYLQDGLAPLEESMTLVYIDTRGSGGSSQPADRRRMSQGVMADDIDHLRERLGLGTIDLLGHSDGGTIGIEYAIRHPQRLRKLVLVAPAVLGDRDAASTQEYMMLWADDPQYREAVKVAMSDWGDNLTDEQFRTNMLSVMPLYFSDPSRFVPEIAKLADLQLSAFAMSAESAAAKAENRDQTRDVGAIRARTLILQGTVDWVCPYPVAQRLHAAMPDSELHLYANKGHLLWMEAPSRFYDEVRTFLAQ